MGCKNGAKKTLACILEMSGVPALDGAENVLLPVLRLGWRGTAMPNNNGIASAFDVVRYEQDELDNDINTHPLVKEALKQYPPELLLWVTGTEMQAKQYGTNTYSIDLPENTVIIGGNDDEGWLVLKPKQKTKSKRPQLHGPTLFKCLQKIGGDEVWDEWAKVLKTGTYAVKHDGGEYSFFTSSGELKEDITTEEQNDFEHLLENS